MWDLKGIVRIMDHTAGIDLTDWATLLEVLDGAKAPFAATEALTGTWMAVLAARESAAETPAEPPRRRDVTWRLEP